MKHMKQDFCIRGAQDGYHKRCKFIPMLEHGIPLSLNEEKRLVHEQTEYFHAMQDIVGHFCYGMTKSVFCQLSHGLVRQFIRAVVDHRNTRYLTFLGNMESHYCPTAVDQNTKRCKIFPVLRAGVPGSGLGARESIDAAATHVAKIKAALDAAKQIRKIAQQAVRKNPTKDSLAALEQATQRELQSEKALHDAQTVEIHKMAEQAGAPSTADVKLASTSAKEMQQLSVKTKETSLRAKRDAATAVTKAKAQVLQTTLKLASATDAVKKSTSPATVEAVQKGMKASTKAKEVLRTVKAKADKSIKTAEQEASKAADEAIAANAKLIKLKAVQKKMFAQFAMRQAQKDADNAEETTMFAKVNAKKASQKLWWAKLHAKDDPSPKNQQAVAASAQEAHKAAVVAEKYATKALGLSHKAAEAAAETENAEDSTEQVGKTTSAHAAVKSAQQEAREAQETVSEQAARVSGPVAKKLVKEAKRKEIKACGSAAIKLQAKKKAKALLDAASAALKESQSPENMRAIQHAHDKYQSTQGASATASSLCEQAQTFTRKMAAGADMSKKSKGEVSAAKLVQATEAAAHASAVVQQAKREEREAVQQQTSRLKQRYTAAVDEAQYADEKAERAKTVVKKLTNVVAHDPSEHNIAALRKALVLRKEVLGKQALATKSMQSAASAHKSALAKLLKTTASSTLKQELATKLHQANLAGLSAIKQKLARATTASKTAQAALISAPTSANKKATMKSAALIQELRTQLAAASQGVAKIADEPHRSIAELQTALPAALKKKEAAKRVAMAEPSNENLDAFRRGIREVHSLQTKLMMAKQAKADELAHLPAHLDVASRSLQNYCSMGNKKDLCAFYKAFQQSGWQDDAGQIGKHLLTKVAKSKQHVQNIEQKLSAIKAKAVSNPSKTIKEQAEEISSQLEAARNSHEKSEKMVQQFMDHQTLIGSKLKKKTKASHIQLVAQIGKLINFYCKNNKYAKLCAFYKKLEDQHTTDIVQPTEWH